MNSKQRRQRKRQAIRIAKELARISIELLDDVENGFKTIGEARAELHRAHTELAKL